MAKASTPPALPLTITPHPSDPRTLFAGSSEGIYKTSDGGQTWRHVYAWAPLALPINPGIPIGDCCFSIAIDLADAANVYVYVAASGLFLASNDSGESWQSRAVPSARGFGNGLEGNAILRVGPNGSGTIAVGLSLSRDHGLNWTSMTEPPMGAPSFTVPDPWNTGWIYAATAAGTEGYLYLSKDWGTTWAARPNPINSGSDARTRAALLSRKCNGGALFLRQGSITSNFDFGLPGSLGSGLMCCC